MSPAELMLYVSVAADIHIAQSHIRRWAPLQGHPQVLLNVLTVVSELGSNICKFGIRGRLHLKEEKRLGTDWIVVTAEDHGPGIRNVEQAMQDSFSTGGSLGLGLPSVRRMADEFVIASAVNGGTVVRVGFRLNGMPGLRDVLSVPEQAKTGVLDVQGQCEVAWACRPLRSEVVCGDRALALRDGNRLLLMLVDATGHGEKARAVAAEAASVVEANLQLSVGELLRALHTALQHGIGAAIGVLSIDLVSGVAEYAGIGNTTICRYAGEHWHPVSRSGVVGQRVPSVLATTAQLKAGDGIVMTTDGLPELASRGFLQRHVRESASWLAANVLKELGKPYDDCACLVVKWFR